MGAGRVCLSLSLSLLSLVPCSRPPRVYRTLPSLAPHPLLLPRSRPPLVPHPPLTCAAPSPFHSYRTLLSPAPRTAPYPGKCIVNSISLKVGEVEFRRQAKIVKRHGGSGCPRDTAPVERIIRSVVRNTPLPVTTTTRSGYHQPSRDPPRLPGALCGRAKCAPPRRVPLRRHEAQNEREQALAGTSRDASNDRRRQARGDVRPGEAGAFRQLVRCPAALRPAQRETHRPHFAGR